MYRDRLENTKTKSPSAKRLQQAMLSYNDFGKVSTLSASHKQALAEWQTNRLKKTHLDLYESPEFRSGLEFLLSDLYTPKDFSGRDRDLERIFPKMVKLLPDSVLETVATLIELNLITQQLDESLGQTIFINMSAAHIDAQTYCEAYRLCDNMEQRRQQINLIDQAGKKLDKYARSSMINFSLKISQGAAEMAGLSALHAFISEGFNAFHGMQNINYLMQTITSRELMILENIYDSRQNPFDLNQQK